MERVQKKISRFICLRGQCNAVSRCNIGLSEPQRKSFLKDFSPTHEKKIYTECARRNVPNFGRVFLMLNYTDITQNTYVQS